MGQGKEMSISEEKGRINCPANVQVKIAKSYWTRGNRKKVLVHDEKGSEKGKGGIWGAVVGEGKPRCGKGRKKGR